VVSAHDNAPAKLPKPVSYDELYPGRFLKAADLKGKIVTVEIASVDREKLVGDKGEQVRGILSFAKTEKQLALNRTNGECIKGMFGRNPQEWVGKRISIYPAKFTGNLPDVDECIRIHGSPDIAADMTVRVVLPLKRPTTMTMHKVPDGQRRAATPATPQWQDVATAEQALRASHTTDALQALYGTMVDEYRTAAREFPVELEAAHNETYENLEQGVRR
jgi:hypothetical protein